MKSGSKSTSHVKHFWIIQLHITIAGCQPDNNQSSSFCGTSGPYNDLICQLELVHCAYQLVQLEGVDAVVEYVEQGVKLGGTWACDGAPSEDIGLLASFLLGFPFLGGAQTVLC